MTLQERQTQAQTAAQGLAQRRVQLIEQVNDATQGLIRLDAELALLETLIAEQAASGLDESPVALVEQAG